jgi:hypothetical protein
MTSRDLSLPPRRWGGLDSWVSPAMAILDEDIKAAEKRMCQAYHALVEYVDRSASQPPDIKLNHRLADDLTLANAQYMTLVSKLKSSS